MPGAGRSLTLPVHLCSFWLPSLDQPWSELLKNVDRYISADGGGSRLVAAPRHFQTLPRLVLPLRCDVAATQFL